MHTVFLTGSKGMLGWAIQQECQTRGWQVLPCARPEFDLQKDPHKALQFLQNSNADSVINAAAYTAVDLAETQPENAAALNAEWPRLLAETCRDIHIPLVHFSTDYVFGSHATKEYNEEDEPTPQGVYATSKAAGEQAVLNSGADHILIRTAWLFGPHGKNFIRTIYQHAQKNKTLRVVNDQIGSPTYTLHLAQATLHLITLNFRGLIHFTSSGECTWFDLAKKIIELSGSTTPCTPIHTASLNQAAPRPNRAVLSKEKYKQFTKQNPAPWQDAVKHYLRNNDSAFVEDSML